MKSSPLYDYIPSILYIPKNHEIFPFDNYSMSMKVWILEYYNPCEDNPLEY